MKKVDPKEILERVVKAVPVDRTAAMVVSKGFRYDSPKKITQAHWEIPPKIATTRAADKWAIGRRFGRFVVVGRISEKYDNKGALWLVRCDCSHYETRRTKSLNNPKNVGDCCDRCRQLIYAKRTQHWRTTGENVPHLDI